MKKNKKAAIVIIATVILWLPLILVGGIVIHDVYVVLTPDYIQDAYIPKGYFKTDGEKGYGAGDLEEYDYYLYDKNPKLKESYSTVDSNNKKELFSALERFGDSSSEINYRNEIYDRVSEGDRFVLKYFEQNGKETQEPQRDNCKIYYYDSESKILFRIRYIW